MANDFSGEIEQRQNNFQHLDATADQLDYAFDNEVVDWDRIIPLAKSAYLTVQEQKHCFQKAVQITAEQEPKFGNKSQSLKKSSRYLQSSFNY